ncbi:DUF262 domain-containing protein [Chryseobacterium indologenes]|uniref:DUF262 domain-containing protein n=1 Tax=Chryseobacterium indologenes TaxID=253 RepID=A0A0N0ZWK8_CHRID|nr:DUF262 domain-containing protein [Chryseobacterium indologenes]KPE52920.1 hypothetical protein AOB46_02730 [Chryseobacterium indologenes]
MKDNTLLLMPVRGLNNKRFIIEKYQRGYKWGKKEILELLNDIREYDHKKGVYCIQPVILKPLGIEKEEYEGYNLSVKNEVIDGQQRMTTIYILLHYLRFLDADEDSIQYSIRYKIREKSGEFLSEKLTEMFGYIPSQINENLLEDKDYKYVAEANNSWKDFVTANRHFDNVDIYHFFIVGYYIKNWFEQCLDSDKQKCFIKKLLHHVHVIWYSLDDAMSDHGVIDVFLNNNKGKISLTTSELIKALFILDISNKESKAVAEYKINRFALEWDQVEKKLQDDTFWYFIQPDSERYNKGTRIDYLFDLKLKQSSRNDDTLAYRKYEKFFNELKDDREGAFQAKWDEIIQLFNKLVDWYNDSFFFHYVGYLTVTGLSSLEDILDLSKGKTKKIFQEKLKNRIKEKFGKTVRKDGHDILAYAVENLHYDDFYKQTQNVLLLYNVLYYVDKMSSNKFPFELYVNEKWSIEHIVPQKPKNLEDFEQYRFWIKDQLEYRKENAEISDAEKMILDELENKSSFEELKKDRELQEQVDKLIESFEDKTHLISNLVLLDRNTNSSLSNHLFKTKRNKILEFDREGRNDDNKPVFIPVETLNAFNKTFSENLKLEQWSGEDGKKYKSSIAERLEYFLPTINS